MGLLGFNTARNRRGMRDLLMFVFVKLHVAVMKILMANVLGEDGRFAETFTQ
jgi:hypothetical protein